MSESLLKLSLKATRLNHGSYPFAYTEDGLSFTGREAFAATRSEAGAVDHAKSARDQFSKAGGLGLIALTPDKTLILGTALGAGGDGEKASAGGAITGSILGLLGDVAEAVPAAALAAGHLLKGLYHATRRATG